VDGQRTYSRQQECTSSEQAAQRRSVQAGSVQAGSVQMEYSISGANKGLTPLRHPRLDGLAGLGACLTLGCLSALLLAALTGRVLLLRSVPAHD
jgi:hypothetical protein